MASDRTEFEKRVARITRHKQALAENGARKKVNRDGLIEYVPKGGRLGLRLRLPLRGLLLLALALFAGKVALVRALGDEAYGVKLARLEQGEGMVDRLGARIMAVDPATRWVSDQIDRLP